MTTLQIQHMSQFGTRATEDPMELTSDIDRCLEADEDIDIDIDIISGNQQEVEDECMEENIDGAPDDALPVEQDMREASDDGMVDESYAGSIPEQTSTRDEDIEDADYTGLDFDENATFATTLQHISDPSQNHDIQSQPSSTKESDHEQYTHNTTDDGDAAVISEPHVIGQGNLAATKYTMPELAEQGLSNEDNREHDIKESPAHTQTQTLGPTNKALTPLGNDLGQLEHDEDLPLMSTEKPICPRAVEDVTSEQAGGNAGLTAASIVEEAKDEDLSTALDKHSHKALPPILVGYQGNEFNLFPPPDQDEEHIKTFFLDDEYHADETIKQLLDVLRSVLAENIDEHDELTISIVDLDLDISESTPENSFTTLRQLIDIYIHLHVNDQLETLPHFYINLTSKPRFYRRMEYLRNAIIEGKGLLQIQPFKVAEGDQQYDAEDEPEHRPEDEAHLVEVAQTSEIGAAGQGGEKENQLIDTDSQNEALLSSRPMHALEPRDFAKFGEDQGTDVAKAQLDVNKINKVAPRADNDVGRVDLTGEVSPAPPTLPPREDQRPIYDGSSMDDGDFVDYEDDEDLARGTSTGSSTLRGDVLEAAPDQDQTGMLRPTAETSELHSSSDHHQNTIQGNHVPYDHSGGQEITVHADATSDGPTDVHKKESEYPEYPNDYSADSPDELLDEEEDHIEDEQDASNTVKGHIRVFDIADDENQNTASSQRATVTYGVDVVPEQSDRVPKDDNPGQGANPEQDEHTDPNNEEQDSPIPVDDEYDFGHASPQEEQTALDDLGREDQAAEAVDNISAKATLNMPALDIAVEHDHQDEDEITYEDDPQAETPQQPSSFERNSAMSPGSLKRVHRLDEDDGARADAVQGAKRVRSG